MKNGARVKGFYEAAARGEMHVLFDALAPKIEWREAEGSPFASGPRAGSASGSPLDRRARRAATPAAARDAVAHFPGFGGYS